MNITEGEQFRGVIREITPAYKLGGKGNHPIAIVLEEGKDTEAWLPLPEVHDFEQGENVLITPKTEHHESGGSSTIYEISKNT